MRNRYENPVLYNSVNQPVDRKTGLIVQQEIPVSQLGRTTQKHDQGFVPFIADRAVAKFFGKKGTRGTAIFLPDRIRFTKKNFRTILFYREIRMVYKSDPNTFCFVLYVIDEKDQKRRYEVYQCDNMEDTRRIEDILEASKHSANRLLLDPAPSPVESRRPSIPVSQYSSRPLPVEATTTRPATQAILECPHCQRLSRVAPDSPASLDEPVAEVHCGPEKYHRENGLRTRSKSAIDLTAKPTDEFRVDDQWRDQDYYGYFNGGNPRKTRTSRYQVPSRKWSVWDDDDYHYRSRDRPTNSQYGYVTKGKPYHVTSNYGGPTTVNRDPTRQRALYQGKPHLNRQTMQVNEPYMEFPETRLRRYNSEPDLTTGPYDNEVVPVSKPKVNKSKDDDIRIVELEKPHENVPSPKLIKENTIPVQNHNPPSGRVVRGNSPIPIMKVKETNSAPVEKNKVVVLHQSIPYGQVDRMMFAERIVDSPIENGRDVIKVNAAPANTLQANYFSPKQVRNNSKVLIEYDMEPAVTPRPYMSPNGY